jgi:O-methyltransferase
MNLVKTVYRKLKTFVPGAVKSKVRSFLGHDYAALVQVEELQKKYKNACTYLLKEIGAASIGDYLEFGVSYGTSLSCMDMVLKEVKLHQVRLFGFDSFEGLPAYAANEEDHPWQPGEYASSIGNTTRFLTKKGVDWRKTFLIKGWYNETLTEALKERYGLFKASLIMIDCDLYSSAKQSLDFCSSLIKDKSIVFFDDWPDVEYKGEKRALDEFSKENQHLKIEEFDSYKPNGKVMTITNTLGFLFLFMFTTLKTLNDSAKLLWQKCEGETECLSASLLLV